MKHLLPCVIVLLIAGRGSADLQAADPRPNVVLILADDLGYADVGFHGCRDIPTPHLDALAAAGVRFTNGYVSGPYCSPSRAGLLTGRYQQRFGHEFNPASGEGLPTSETTLADRLQAAGYTTELIGKWHLGDLPEMQPQRRGFDEFFGFLAGGHDYFNSQRLLRGHEKATTQGYLTDVLAEEAVAFIDRQQQRPFFLFLSFNAVHTPRQADEARLKKFAGIADMRRRTYAAMTSALDDGVGRVRAKLAETGLADNTLVMFLSDNGGPVLHGTSTTPNGSSNAPLRGSKRNTYEGGIRVPLIVSWPARLKPAVYHHPVIQLDLFPTALAAAGVPMQTEWQLDGVGLLPFLAGGNMSEPHEALYWRFGQQMAIRVGDYKLVRSAGETNTGDLSATISSRTARLFRLPDDIGESTDLAAEMPDKVKELQDRWNAWNATLAPPLWPDRP